MWRARSFLHKTHRTPRHLDMGYLLRCCPCRSVINVFTRVVRAVPRSRQTTQTASGIIYILPIFPLCVRHPIPIHNPAAQRTWHRRNLHLYAVCQRKHYSSPPKNTPIYLCAYLRIASQSCGCWLDARGLNVEVRCRRHLALGRTVCDGRRVATCVRCLVSLCIFAANLAADLCKSRKTYARLPSFFHKTLAKLQTSHTSIERRCPFFLFIFPLNIHI